MANKDEERARRLAAALRDNLRRRKQQQRGSAEQAVGDGNKNGERDDQA